MLFCGGEEDRKVDRTGCFKFNGEVYEAGSAVAGKKVEIRFDPFDGTEIEVWHKGQKVAVAKKLLFSPLTRLDS